MFWMIINKSEKEKVEGNSRTIKQIKKRGIWTSLKEQINEE